MTRKRRQGRELLRLSNGHKLRSPAERRKDAVCEHRGAASAGGGTWQLTSDPERRGGRVDGKQRAPKEGAMTSDSNHRKERKIVRLASGCMGRAPETELIKSSRGCEL